MGARTGGNTASIREINHRLVGRLKVKERKTSVRLVTTVGYTTSGIRQYSYTRIFVATPTSRNRIITQRLTKQPRGLYLIKTISPSILNLLDVTLLLAAASQAGPVVGIPLDGVDVLLGSTDLEGSLASLKVASVVLRTEEGEDDDVRGNDTNKDALNEGVVRYDLGAGRGLDGDLVLFTAGCGREKEG